MLAFLKARKGGRGFQRLRRERIIIVESWQYKDYLGNILRPGMWLKTRLERKKNPIIPVLTMCWAVLGTLWTLTLPVRALVQERKLAAQKGSPHQHVQSWGSQAAWLQACALCIRCTSAMLAGTLKSTIRGKGSKTLLLAFNKLLFVNSRKLLLWSFLLPLCLQILHRNCYQNKSKMA